LSYKDEANKEEKDNLRSFLRNSINQWMNNPDNQLDDVNINSIEWDIIEMNTSVVWTAKFIILKWYK
jgi:predicted DNA-binding ribbon-helix-helix protein